MEAKDEEIADLRAELSEYVPIRFQQQSRAYEDALEQELESKDRQISELRDQVAALQEHLATLSNNYRQSEAEVGRLQATLAEYLKELEKHRAEKRELELLNDDWERSKRYSLPRILEFSNQELEQRLNTAEEYAIMYKEELDEISAQTEVEIQRLKDQIRILTEDLEQIQAKEPADDDRVKVLEEALTSALEEKLKLKAELEKPKVHRTTSTLPMEYQPIALEPEELNLDVNEENEGGQSIRVFARVRSLQEEEKREHTSIDVRTKELGALKSGRYTTKQFPFERVFSPSSTNAEVFTACQSTIEEVLTGGSVCILAYGQTGSGKTFTMRGLMEQSMETITKLNSDGERVEISLQCVEIYNDLVRNLFTLESEGRSNKLREFLARATVPLLDYSTEAIWQLIAQANDSRVTKYTEANERSSRSHLLITFTVKRRDVVGKLMFVDLAGSERLSSSKAKGDMYFPLSLKETLCINKSLTSLQDVIAALEAKAAYVPYRNSVLTVLLQPVLMTNTSKVVMLFMVNPAEEAVGETICTLSLGVRLKSVELGANIRQGLKNRNYDAEQVERTFLLLEKEREEKYAVLRSKEKLERDLNSYLHALKEKDNRIAVLTTRIKQQERDHSDVVSRLKKEAEDYKQQFHNSSRKCRQLQAKLETQVKKESSPTEVSNRGFPGSLSPPREDVYAGIKGGVSPKSGSSRVMLTPTAQKTTLRPRSAPKHEDPRTLNLKFSSRS